VNRATATWLVGGTAAILVTVALILVDLEPHDATPDFTRPASPEPSLERASTESAPLGDVAANAEEAPTSRVPVKAARPPAAPVLTGRVVLPAGASLDRELVLSTSFDRKEGERMTISASLAFSVPIPDGAEQCALDLVDEEFYLPAPKCVYALDPPVPEVLLEPERTGRIEVHARLASEIAVDTEPLTVGLIALNRGLQPEGIPGPWSETIEGRDGSCAFEALRASLSYRLTCTGGELVLPVRAWDLVVRPGETTRVELLLESAACVVGHVSTQDGLPVPGVRVGASEVGKGETGHNAATTTGTDGAYRLPRLPVGEIELSARVPLGFCRGEDVGVFNELRSADGAQLVLHQELARISGGEERTVDWIVPPLGEIAGRVRWPDGRPARDARVRAGTTAESDPQIDTTVSGRTSAEGGFAFRARAGTEIEVFVVAEQEQEGRFWYADWHGMLPMGSTRTELDLVLERGTAVHGCVMDHAGSPIPAFRLLWNAQSASGLVSEASTEMFATTDGCFVVHVPRGGSLDLRAFEVLHSQYDESYGAMDERLVISESDDGFSLHVQQVSVVSGLVVDATGRLLKNVPVEMHWRAHQGDEKGYRTEGATCHITDPDGAFQFPLSIPESDVRVFVTGEPSTSIEFQLSPGEVRRDLVLEL
jgi:hypothetical protein